MLLIILLCTTPFSADRVEIIREQEERVVHLLGNVVIEDEKTRITCDEAFFHETQNYVILLKNVSIVDGNGEMKAQTALYYFEDMQGYLTGSVSLHRTDQTISADSLYYSGRDARVEMFSNVTIEDQKNNVRAIGGRGWYDLQLDDGYLLEHPLMNINRENKDPIRITALMFKLDTDSNQFYGIDSVVALVDSITIYCDTFTYHVDSARGEMAQPFVVDEKNTLKGDRGQFRMKDNEIESFSVEHGWSRYYTDEGSRNVVEGKQIRIVFSNGKATRIEVDGEPEGVLYLKGEEGAGNKESE
jgi:lipopolysaccharide assembly outer membrane protein LptD (OstA)